jgi:hypothetical protein
MGIEKPRKKIQSNVQTLAVRRRLLRVGDNFPHVGYMVVQPMMLREVWLLETDANGIGFPPLSDPKRSVNLTG